MLVEPYGGTVPIGRPVSSSWQDYMPGSDDVFGGKAWDEVFKEGSPYLVDGQLHVRLSIKVLP